MQVNTEVMIGGRLAAGMSQRELARRTGLSMATIRRLEAGGSCAELPVRVLAKVAEEISSTVGSLLEAEALEDAPAAADGDKILEALLAEHGSLSSEEVCAATGWTLTDCRDAAEQLAARLRSTGLRLVRGRSGHRAFKLAGDPAVLPATTTQRAAQARLSRGMDLVGARHLYRAWDAKLRQRDVMANNDQVAVARLMKAGLLRQDDGRLVVTDDVAFSLLREC